MTIQSPANPNPALIKHYLKTLLKSLEEKHAATEDYKDWDQNGPKNVPGAVERGNIDLSTRPDVQRTDEETGKHSSLYSTSFGTDKGEVLVPRISDKGEVLTEDQARDEYNRTGKHLGIFNSVDAANAYANLLHEKQSGYQASQGKKPQEFIQQTQALAGPEA